MDRNRGGRPRHPDVLTPAEWRVLEALREGGTNAEIAARLGLSLDTVKYHISNMLAKLELRDRRALASWRPDPERRRLGAVLAVPAVLWAVVGRPLVWVGLGTAAVAGVAAAVVAAVGVVVVAFVLATGDSDASPFAASSQSAPEPVVSCDSGIAVTNPATNTELVGDCEALLGLRDTIRGTGRLNWTAGKPMAEWMGVTVSGTPQRVTALNLAGLGLDGKLSGLLGNLTGLTELRLNGNTLTGMLPSKLGQLTSLTTVSLSGTDFEGCAPPVLREAATNDVDFDDCGDPVDWSTDADAPKRRSVMPAGTYRLPVAFDGDSFTRSLVFDIPSDDAFIFTCTCRAYPDGTVSQEGAGGNQGIVFDAVDGTAKVGLDIEHGGAWGNTYILHDAPAAIAEAAQRILESWWHDP